MSDLDLTNPNLPDFLARQARDFGGNLEIDSGTWAVFGIETSDTAGDTLAHQLLAHADFPHDSGTSEDDRWTLYFVDTPNRPAAIHWLDDLQKRLSGDIRSASPSQRGVMQELLASTMPHRVAQMLADQHERGDLSAGSLCEPALLRALLDRLHAGEPLFYTAFYQLLEQHLLDLVVLLQQLIPEDIEAMNDTVRGSLSQDPFLRTRQAAAADIRHLFTRFYLINSLDQQKNTAIPNPYAAYLEIIRIDDQLRLPIDGANVATSRANFIQAIRSIRRNLYRGGDFRRFDTQVPWMRDDIAYPFRFIKQRLEMRRELAPMDGLYMLERAAEV